jgi:hypothetical protein
MHFCDTHFFMVNMGSHLAQASPAVPQSASSVPGWHNISASQQPDAQVAAPHGEQTCSWQTLLVDERQFRQSTPPFPQLPAVLPAWHLMLASQQPSGQVVPSHKRHACMSGAHLFPPAVQSTHSAAFPQLLSAVPGLQSPVVSQHPLGQLVESHAAHPFWWHTLSDVPVQSLHGPPPVPQYVSDSPVTHVPPGLQQPSGQVVGPHGRHSFWWHVSAVFVQSEHPDPPVPQIMLSSPARHAPSPSQHPSGHEIPLHAWHALLSQRRFFSEQSLQLSPPVPHSVAESPGRHLPLWSQHPSGQVDGPHLKQFLSTHLAELKVQSAHLEPPAPHSVSVVP